MGRGGSGGGCCSRWGSIVLGMSFGCRVVPFGQVSKCLQVVGRVVVVVSSKRGKWFPCRFEGCV